MKLGSLVNTIRNRNAHKEHKEELLAMGFDYKKQQEREFEEVKEALLAYKKIFGDLLVPNEYIIPVNDIKYPGKARGMLLGQVVRRIRNGNTYRSYKNELMEMGFDYILKNKN